MCFILFFMVLGIEHYLYYSSAVPLGVNSQLDLRHNSLDVMYTFNVFKFTWKCHSKWKVVL